MKYYLAQLPVRPLEYWVEVGRVRFQHIIQRDILEFNFSSTDLLDNNIDKEAIDRYQLPGIKLKPWLEHFLTCS